MERLNGRKLLFCALALVACGVDPTENEGTPTTITANPEVVFVTQGDSQPVIVSLTDEDGQIIEADFEAGNVGTGITVSEDPNFLGTTTGIGIRRQARFFVKGVDLTATSFELSALGLTKTIEVTSVPGVLAGTISNLTPVLGDTISITAPTGTFFTETSELTFGGAAPVVVSRDAQTITFIPFPNIVGPAVVSDVGVTSNPDLLFTLATPDTVRTDSIANIGANVTPTTPGLGAPVTLVLPTGLKVIPESLTVAAGPPPTLGLQVAGSEVAPINVTVSADSSTITFVPPPNADSFVVVPGVINQRLPMYPLELTTTAKVTTPVVTAVPSNVSDAAPDVNEPVTLTRTDGSYAFGAGATVTVGAIDAFVSSIAGDGSSLTFTAPPGATGPVTVTGVELAGFSLTLPSSAAPITVSSTIPTLPGTEASGTAPQVITPDEGGASLLVDKPPFDGAGVVDAYYEFVVTEEGVYTITMDWDIGTDVDLFVCPAAGVDEFDCDFQAATGDHPEVGEYALTPGTYYIVADDFAAYDEAEPGVPDTETEPAIGATLQITIEHGPPEAAIVARAKAATAAGVRKAHK